MNEKQYSRVEQLSAEQRQHVIRNLKTRLLNSNEVELGPREGRTAPVPLSYAQHRLWTFQQIHPESRAYNEFTAFRFEGRLKLDVLEQSLDSIVERHEALRSRFQEKNGLPIQVTVSDTSANLKVIDLTDIPATKKLSQVKSIADQESNHLFQLDCEPPLRLTLVRLADDQNFLLVAAHHLILDGWSIDIFRRELALLYCAIDEGQPSPLPDLPIQYADYAVWLRKNLRKEILDEQIMYWRDQLSDLPPLLEIPIAKARPGVESFRGARHRFELSEELSQDIRTLSRSENSTLFTTLLAGFIVLLHRYTGLADFAVGTTSANRHHPHMESLIGFFVNSLVLRADLAGNPTTREVLRRVNRVAIDAFEHSQVPFDFVVEALRPNRSSSHSPLFQVLFDFRGKSKQCPQLPGISIKIEDIAEVTTRLDLILSMEETVTGIKGYWQYNTDLFDPSAIARMSSHLETLLHAMVTDPSRPIGSLPLLTAEEHHQIVDQWNHTDASFDIEGGVVDWFLSQVDQNPDATAVVDSQRSVTYRELDSRASQIAHCLLDLGVKPNSLVGVYVDRSVEAIEAIFGALKAGAAYVPLDPAFPRERLRLVLDEIDVSAILTVEDRVIDNSVAGAPQLCLDSATIDSASTHSPELAFHPEHLAYVMFTSGSSGKPKGVAVTHANLQHSILARCEYYQEVPRAFLSLSSFAFDSSVAGIFWTLTQGGKLVLSPVEAVVNVADIWERVEAHSITHTLLIPSLYQLLLAELPSRKSTSLQTVIVAGEQCPPRLVASHQKHLGATHLYNEYGPTEATVWSTVYKCDSPTTSRIPIGRPISNTRVYLLDTYKQPVPLGTPGELYIAGGGVASGYINDVVNTEEKFVQTDLEQSRLYRTGDLARYLSDGNIELIGRIDQQVQIRGYRIELGEIEAALKHHAGVYEAVATLCGEEDHQRLVAYVEVGTDVSEDSLYRHLQAKMPTYAWPQIIVREHLPRLPNGKIDRCALDEVPACDSTHAQEWTGLERAIAEVWQETLGIDSVKRDDNFFRIGGDSLSAIRVFNQIQAMTDSELAITDLFKHTTVSSLAEYLHKEVVIGEL